MPVYSFIVCATVVASACESAVGRACALYVDEYLCTVVGIPFVLREATRVAVPVYFVHARACVVVLWWFHPYGLYPCTCM